MHVFRLAALMVLLLALAPASGSAQPASPKPPTGLHGFLLRADEPSATSFDRTPAFAWNPVSGATGYEFQLSTSSVFRENGIIYATPTDPKTRLTTPVVAPPLTLPWITGDPHALYARVRAVTQDSISDWSVPFGFDMAPPAPPKPLSSYPGLLRWTPIEGADAYEIWLIDAKKMEFVTTNVLDEREFYTFHQSSAWTGTIRWRVRALRDVVNSSLNKVTPAVYGPWSSVYSSTNPAATGGPIKLLGTVSDVYSDGTPTSPAHRLMPAFLFSGNQTAGGTAAELFRVYVFTDKQCLNPVLVGSVTGAPAFSPRPYGQLSLPTLAVSLQAARGLYLPDVQPHTPSTIDFSYDGATLSLSESADAATPTAVVPGAPGETTTGGTGSSGGSSGSSGSSSGSSGGSSGSSGSTGGFGPAPAGGIAFSGDPGAPIDLWDTDWPGAGYYWTVIPVAAVQPGALTTFVRAPGSKTLDTSIPVTSTTGFNIGDVVTIGGTETATITGIGDGTLGVTALTKSHTEGQIVARTGGDVQYIDLELPQDVCAAPINRVARFGKDSEVSLTSSGDLFATGLSANGRLTSALHTPSFYGSPLVSWTPALGAQAYQVQWSRSKYPFVPVLDPTSNTKGFLTTGTSAVLQLGSQPGIWWYRVRGLDFALPTGAQQMSWSDPAQIVITKPTLKIVSAKSTTFKVIGAAAKKKSGKK